MSLPTVGLNGRRSFLDAFQNATGANALRHAAFNDNLTIDDHPAKAGRKLVRVFVRGVIANLRWIEDQ